MASYRRIERLLCLYERADRYAKENRQLLTERSAKSVAFLHLQKVDRFYSRVWRLAGGFTPDAA
jgi:hypothetical protein